MREVGFSCLLLASIALAVTAGCQSVPPPAPPLAEPTPAPKPVVVLTEEQIQAIKLGYLLDEAEAALAEGRLLLPEDDNALMWFEAALQLAPENVQASSGIQQIMVNYAQLVREALAKGRVEDAEFLVHRLLSRTGSNHLIEQLQGGINDARQAMGSRQSLSEHRILLDREPLRRRDASLQAQLQQLAVAAREQGQMLLIHARNDAEGRWIYQQMREGVPGYRLRADIVIAETPSIDILPAP